jgi:hypothetical protein
VEVRGAAGQNDDGARWIWLQLFTVEVLARTDVEDAGDDRVDAILRVPVGHQLDTGGNLDPDYVRARLRRLADDHGEASCRRERGERLPFDVFG